MSNNYVRLQVHLTYPKVSVMEQRAYCAAVSKSLYLYAGLLTWLTMSLGESAGVPKEMSRVPLLLHLPTGASPVCTFRTITLRIASLALNREPALTQTMFKRTICRWLIVPVATATSRFLQTLLHREHILSLALHHDQSELRHSVEPHSNASLRLR